VSKDAAIGGAGVVSVTTENVAATYLRALAGMPPHHRIMSAAIHAAMQPSMPCIREPSAEPDYESIMHREVHRRLCAALHAIADKLDEPGGL
jgi:hypothetical protein